MFVAVLASRVSLQVFKKGMGRNDGAKVLRVSKGNGSFVVNVIGFVCIIWILVHNLRDVKCYT